MCWWNFVIHLEGYTLWQPSQKRLLCCRLHMEHLRCVLTGNNFFVPLLLCSFELMFFPFFFFLGVQFCFIFCLQHFFLLLWGYHKRQSFCLKFPFTLWCYGPFWIISHIGCSANLHYRWIFCKSCILRCNLTFSDVPNNLLLGLWQL